MYYLKALIRWICCIQRYIILINVNGMTWTIGLLIVDDMDSLNVEIEWGFAL
jgi:hypothetical protein